MTNRHFFELGVALVTLGGLAFVLAVLTALYGLTLAVLKAARWMYRAARRRRDAALNRHIHGALSIFDQPTVQLDMRDFHRELADAGLLLRLEDPR